MKRIIASCFIILIISMNFIIGYTKSDSLVYADSNTDSWLDVTTNEQLADAFRYYCKSRDLTIEGSAADALTSFTTKTFNGLCNTLGIDMTALQAQIKYQTDGNTGTRFLFSALGIDAYNRIFAQFLQDNELSVGDTVDEEVFQGKMLSGQLVYSFNYPAYPSEDYYSISKSNVVEGSIYPHSAQFYIDEFAQYASGASKNYSIPLVDGNFNYTVNCAVYSNNTRAIKGNRTQSSYGGYYYRSDLNNPYTALGDCIFYNSYIDTYFFGVVGLSGSTYYFKGQHEISNNYNNQASNVTVNIVTNDNKTINNNTYEGDTIINNEGDVINNDNDTTINYNPYPDGGGTTSNPNNTGGGSGEDDSVITFPNFDFHFPEIDWSLGDLSEKFPFSIPFDLIAFFTVLNAEPQAPAINADIPLGTWYTWHFEADFAQFDNWAEIIRNVEFIGFCVGLIYLTIRLVKG